MSSRRALPPVAAAGIAFSQYLDDKAVNQILADPSRLALGGERRELTVLFSDIRGFTQLAEDLDPLKLIELLRVPHAHDRARVERAPAYGASNGTSSIVRA
jgi:class 3 adenylate cyclase